MAQNKTSKADDGRTKRARGINWLDLMEMDSRPVPEFLRTESYEYLGSDPIPVERYTSREFMQLEAEKMWPNVWQFAAREEDMPEAGDYVVYENAGRSFLVVRQEDRSVRAFHNVCLHRGRKLRTDSGCASAFQCPFHGFTWNTDGSLKKIPNRWDFGHLTDEKLHLPEAETGCWGGYIFIRENPGGPSLEEFLAPLPQHFERWKHEQCATAIWVGKVVPANWKVTAEAFMEAWHTVVTHPEILPFTGDENSAYWYWGDNVNVNLVPFGIPSPHVSMDGRDQQWIVDEFVKYNGRSAENYDPESDIYAVDVPEGKSAREALGDAMRENYTKLFGHDHSEATDAEVLDALVYNVFPNFAPWGGFMPNIVYRWRPWKDPDHCLMEVRIMMRVPPGEKPPRGPEMRFLNEDEPWTEASELGFLAAVFEQDMGNLPYVQEGLKCSKNGRVELGDYQEIRIRQFHRTLEKYLGE